MDPSTSAATSQGTAQEDPLDDWQPLAPAGPMPCAKDPSVETYLRCGRCEKPICPRCLIQTPVGSRCRDCAQLRRLPMFEIRPLDYLKGIGGGLAAGIGCGLAMVLIQRMIPFLGIFGLMMVAAMGYGVGEAINWCTRRKRGVWLATIAALCVPIGLIGAWAILLMVSGADPQPALLAAGLRVFGGSLWGLLGLGFGAAIAFYRVR